VNIEVKNLFPVPLFKTEYQDQTLCSNLTQKFLEIEKDDKNPAEYCLAGYTSFGRDDNVLFWEECADLLDFIGNSVASCHNHVGLAGNVVHAGSWFSINRKHAFHERHNHIPHTWSGVYYLQSAEDQDAPLTFINKNFDNNWPYCTKYGGEYIASSGKVFVNTGDLGIFPSYLEQKVDEQIADTERITIAFNSDVFEE